MMSLWGTGRWFWGRTEGGICGDRFNIKVTGSTWDPVFFFLFKKEKLNVDIN